MKTPRAPREAFKKAPRSLRGDGWRLREGFAKASRRREPFAKAPRRAHCVNASWRRREGFTEPSRRLREDTPPRWVQQGFATAPWGLRGAPAASQRGVAFATASRRLRGEIITEASWTLISKPSWTLQMGSTINPEPLWTAKDNMHRQRLGLWVSLECNLLSRPSWTLQMRSTVYPKPLRTAKDKLSYCGWTLKHFLSFVAAEAREPSLRD